MRKILLILSIAIFAFVGCKDDDNGLMDPNAKIYINADKSTRVYESDNPDYLSAHEVVEQMNQLRNTVFEMGMGDWNRDLVNNRVIGSSTWVVAQAGTLAPEFISSRDNILTIDKDFLPIAIIAYIPNSVMIELEKKITEAYNNEDYATCYALFDEGYIFRPINDADYKALKDKGEH